MSSAQDLTVKYSKWFRKKTQGKPEPMVTLQHRTLNTAIAVVSMIEEIPFKLLSSSLYFYCADLKASALTRMYESALELAGADADKFIKTLHKFYNDVSRKIKEDDLYQEFFEFASASMVTRYQSIDKGLNEAVLNAYQSLLMQTLEYLRPSKFNLSELLCGRTTQGELMVTEAILPNLDLVSYAIEDEAFNSKKGEMTPEFIEARICEVGKRYGYSIHSIAEYIRLGEVDKFYTHHNMALLPYINEYTFDIFPDPKKPFSTRAYPFESIYSAADLAALKEKLHHRARAIAANGVWMQFNYNSVPAAIEGVLFKEAHYGDRVVMLYKVKLEKEGEVCGYYDTKDETFYTPILETRDQKVIDNFQKFILSLYACEVCRDGDKELLQLPDTLSFTLDLPMGKQIVRDYTVTSFRTGGKARNIYAEANPNRKTGPRLGNDKYVHEERELQGFVRKVGPGKTPSQEAVAYAKALGYDLAADETYVRPFIKRVLKLRRKLDGEQ